MGRNSRIETRLKSKTIYYSIMYRLIVDTREHDLIMIIPKLIEQYKVPIVMVVETLDIGDIELRRDTEIVCVFERKSLTDLASSITDGRYKEQSLRLKEACELPDSSKYYILEGDIMRYKPRTRGRPVTKAVLYGAITSLTYSKGFQVLKTSCLQETAELLVRFADKVRRIDEDKKGGTERIHNVHNVHNNEGTDLKEDYTHVVNKVKHKNITPANIGVICLSQIPYVSTTIAKELIRVYGTLRECIEKVCTCPEELETIKINGRKLSCRVIQNLKTYLGGQESQVIHVDGVDT